MSLQGQQTLATTGLRPTNSLLRRIFSLKKSNAKRSGVAFTISFEEIEWPTHCPLLGIELNYGLGNKGYSLPASQSFDRIDSTLGYIPDNVRIISHKANQMKSTASVGELMRLACHLKILEEYNA